LELAVRAARASDSKVTPSTMALGLLSLGPYLCYHNRFDEGCEALSEAAQLYEKLDNPVGLMWTRYQQSFFPASGDPKACAWFASEAASLARQVGSPVLMAYALTRLAETTILASASGDALSPDVLETVMSLCEEAGLYCRQLPQSYASGVAKVAAGTAMALQGSEAEGFLLIDEGIAERSRFQVSVPCAGALASAGQLAHRLGYEDRALGLFSRGLKALKDEGLPYSARSALVGVAAALRKREPIVAARLLGAARGLRPSFIYGLCLFDDEHRLLDDVRAELGDDSYFSELGHGQRLTARTAIDLALSHLGHH
jgi:hypothetical protein